MKSILALALALLLAACGGGGSSDPAMPRSDPGDPRSDAEREQLAATLLTTQRSLYQQMIAVQRGVSAEQIRQYDENADAILAAWPVPLGHFDTRAPVYCYDMTGQEKVDCYGEWQVLTDHWSMIGK
jgi:hypothetical protein